MANQTKNKKGKIVPKKAVKKSKPKPPKKTKEQRKADYKLIRDAGFSSEVARRYRDLTKKEIKALLKTKELKPIDIERSKRARASTHGYQKIDTFFRLYNYEIMFKREDGNFGFFMVSSDHILTDEEAIERAKEIYNNRYNTDNPIALPYASDSDPTLSRPIPETMEITRKIRGNKKKLHAEALRRARHYEQQKAYEQKKKEERRAKEYKEGLRK